MDVFRKAEGTELHMFDPSKGRYCAICGKDYRIESDVCLGRVVFEAAPWESIGNKEIYVVSQKLPAYAHTWMLIEVDGDSSPLTDRNGFQDREGNWWLQSHDFHHLNEHADSYWVDYVNDNHWWENWNKYRVML